MSKKRALKQRLRSLYEEQRLAVLATVDSEGKPYTSLMVFTIDEDLVHLFFATRSDTQKYRNLQHEADVALLIDNRQEQEEDLENALAVTIEGQVYEAKEPVLPGVRQVMTHRYPQLEPFFAQPETCFFFVEIDRHIAVKGLGQVEVLEMKDGSTSEHGGQEG